MSELQTRFIVDTYLDYFYSGNHDLAQIYLKSEADKVIADKDAEIAQLQAMLEERNRQIGNLDAIAKRNQIAAQTLRKKMNHQKYKRCLAMAEMCKAKYDEEDAKVNDGLSWEYISPEMKYWERWRNRWLALAKKFKEAK